MCEHLKSVQKHAFLLPFIIINDFRKIERKRKREKAFTYALEMTSNQVVTFSMVTVGLPGMLGDEVADRWCFCQPAAF